MRPYHRWSTEETAQCRKLYKLGLTVKQIALKLRRTPGSIHGKIYRESVLGPGPQSQQPALIRFLLEAPATKAEIFSQGFHPTPLKNLVTRGHVVGRTFRGHGQSRTYEVTNEGKRNLNSRYPNPAQPPTDRPG